MSSRCILQRIVCKKFSILPYILVIMLFSNCLANPFMPEQIDSSSSWQNISFPSQNGVFILEYDVIPDGVQGSVVTSLSYGRVYKYVGGGSWGASRSGYHDTACAVRFGDKGEIEAYNENGYSSVTNVSYEAGEVYRVRMEVDIPRHIYTVFVFFKGQKFLIAEDYKFRRSQANAQWLNNLAIIALSGTHAVKNGNVVSSTYDVSFARQHSLINNDQLDDISLIKRRTVALLMGRGLSGVSGSKFHKQQLRMMTRDIEPALNHIDQYNWTRNAETINYSQLEKLKLLAVAYSIPDQVYYQDQRLKSLIIKKLNETKYWMLPDTERPGNWFNWQIGYPRLLLETMVIFENELDQEIKDELLTGMDQWIGRMPRLSGVNKVMEGWNHYLYGLLLQNHYLIQRAIDSVGSELKVSDYDGIMEDLSFQFHDRNPYTGLYGSLLAELVAQIMYVTTGTNYELPADNIDIFLQHLVEHVPWTIYHGVYDLAVVGRAHRYPRSVNRHLNAYSILAHIDTPYREQFRESAIRLLDKKIRQPSTIATPLLAGLSRTSVKPLKGIRYWYRSDLLSFRRPGFHVSVKMFSDHVADYEGLWGQNESGWNMSNGMTYITRTGREFWTSEIGKRREIDWERIPGTTSRLNAHPDRSLNFGKSSFVGGATGDQYGIVGFQLIPSAGEFKAKKSYFFFRDGFVAVGSDIDGTHAESSVITTISQWFRNDPLKPMYLANNEMVVEKSKAVAHGDIPWVFHDRVGYILNDVESFNYEMTDTCLKLWIDHGVAPDNQKYAYTVLPKCNKKKLETYLEQKPLEVVINTSSIHAVRNKVDDSFGVVFWEPGQAGKVSVDKPAIVYFQKDADKGELVVCNPLHTQDKVQISIETDMAINDLPSNARLVSSGKQKVIEIETDYGRAYRIGFGQKTVDRRSNVQVGETERQIRLDWVNSEEATEFTISIPEGITWGDCRLMIRGLKGQLRSELNDKNIIEELSSNTRRYQWNNSQVKPGEYYLYISMPHHRSVKQFILSRP